MSKFQGYVNKSYVCILKPLKIYSETQIYISLLLHLTLNINKWNRSQFNLTKREIYIMFKWDKIGGITSDFGILYKFNCLEDTIATKSRFA